MTQHARAVHSEAFLHFSDSARGLGFTLAWRTFPVRCLARLGGGDFKEPGLRSSRGKAELTSRASFMMAFTMFSIVEASWNATVIVLKP